MLTPSTGGRNRRLGLLFACITAGMWSVLAIVLKVASQMLDSYTIVWIRFSIAAVSLLLIFKLARPRSLAILRAPPWQAVLAGLFLGGNYIGYMNGIALTSPSNAQILAQLGPLLLILMGVYFFQEKIDRLQKFGFFIALVGFSLFYSDQISNVLGSPEVYATGNLWIIFGAFTWSGFAVLQKKLVNSFDPQELNLVIYLVSTLAFLPMADLSALGHLSVVQWVMVIYLGLNTLVAYGALGIALKHLEANKTSIIITLNPILTIFFMNLLEAFDVNWIKGEQIELRGYLGAALVILGAIVVVGKLNKQPPQPKPSEVNP